MKSRKSRASRERAMSRHSCCGRSSIMWHAMLAALLLVAGPLQRPSFAQASQSESKSDALTPVEEFSRQLDELKRTFTDLNKRIESSAKAIDGATDPVVSRKQIEELRSVVGALLGAVADNGEVAKLGAKALEHARAKAQSLRDETRFTRE